MPDPFISTEDLSDMLGRDVTGDNGATIAVSVACDICRGIANQAFTPGTSTISLDGQGSDVLVLPQQPVTKVGTVTVGGVDEPNFMVTDHGLLLRGTAGGVWPLGSRPAWPRGRQNVTITYEHGYDTIPNDLVGVALSIAERLVVQGAARSEVLGDVQITYAAASSEVTRSEERILKGYWRPQSF